MSSSSYLYIPRHKRPQAHPEISAVYTVVYFVREMLVETCVERDAGNQELGVHHPLDALLVSGWLLLWKLTIGIPEGCLVYGDNLKFT